MRSSLLVLLMVVGVDAFAGPKVDIVVGKDAPALERLAADELASQLKRVFDAETQIAAEPLADASHVIFVGSPATNPALQPYAKHWPEEDKKLSDQGHLLRTITHRDRPALMIGGGSAVATFWAVAEYGHRLGIRVTLAGDLMPVAPPEFTLAGYKVVLEPTFRDRAWTMLGTSPLGTVAWSLADQQALLRQLAKQKVNHIVLSTAYHQPFVHYEFEGVKKQTGLLWTGPKIAVSGDTAGRAAFRGAAFFENPDFVDAKSYDARIAVGTKMIRGLIATARELGMTVALSFRPFDFPLEFPFPAAGKPVDRDQVARLAHTQVRAYLNTYPDVDEVKLAISNLVDWESLSSDPQLFRRADGRAIDVAVSLSVNSPLSTAMVPLRNEKSAQAKRIISATAPARMTTALSGDSVQLLPQILQSVVEHWQRDPRKPAWEGYAESSLTVGDLDLGAYGLSRHGFGVDPNPQNFVADFVTPVSGESVYERVRKAFEFADSATNLIREHDQLLAYSRPEVILRHYGDSEPPPAWWNEVRDHYLNAMNEMYRANTRAREGGRAFTLYHARRFEFGYEYMNCVEAVRKAGIAAKAKDTATEIAELEKAIESLHAGLNAMAAISRSQSDRAIIAVLNEYGYRPLKKKLAEAEEAQ